MSASARLAAYRISPSYLYIPGKAKRLELLPKYVFYITEDIDLLTYIKSVVVLVLQTSLAATGTATLR